MQKHEGPRRNREAEKRDRQRLMTQRLLIAIGILGAVLLVTLLRRFVWMQV